MKQTLTVVYDDIVDCIVTNVTVKSVFGGGEVATSGIWDTGATASVITRSAAMRLGLKPVSIARVRGVHGEHDANVYVVEIALHDGQISLTASVTECDELSGDGSVGVLIGMDIIQTGNFCISHEMGRTVMSFVKPPQGAVDFSKDNVR